jgi:putative aldouronate transport system permease protein
MAKLVSAVKPSAQSNSAALTENQLRKLAHTPLTQRIWKYRERYILLLPAVTLFILLRYIPMAGIVLAWKKFTVMGGLFGSPWAGWTYFRRLFTAPDFSRVLRNTIFINGVLRMGIAFPMPIVFALMLNEIINMRYKRIVQTISYLPHFLSWVVVASLIRPLASITGPFNMIAGAAGAEVPILFLQRPTWFLIIITVSDIWKGIGWGSIVYLAAISGIDPALYESAEIDGARRFQKMRYITLPSITFVIVILFLLRLGNILELGFDQIFNLYNPLVYNVGDIIGTYVYRVGLQDFRYSFATAVGLFQNLVGLVALVGANAFVKKIGHAGAYTIT